VRGKASEDDRVLSYVLGNPLERTLLALAAAESKAISTQVRALGWWGGARA